MSKWLVAAGFHGACGVALGAWAAHGAIPAIGAEAAEWVRTGTQYQLWHAAALLALVGLPAAFGRAARWAGWCFSLGALLFSGSLYVLALLGWRWAVYVTPFGGMLLLLGWMVLLIFGSRAWRERS
jgi:uncharacterized membrane protein YgdD (TMEM256/DUF423 family)